MNRKEKLDSLKYRYGRKRTGEGGMSSGPGPAGPPGHGPAGPPGPGRGRRMGRGRPKNSGETIRRLLRYLQGDTPKLLAAFVCIIVNTLGTLAGAYMLRPIINTYIVPVDG